MRELLSDILPIASLVQFLKVVDEGDDVTVIKGSMIENNIPTAPILIVRAKKQYPELCGSFVMPDLDTLKGLLGFTPYKEQPVTTVTREWNDKPVVSAFRFEDAKGVGNSTFRCAFGEAAEAARYGTLKPVAVDDAVFTLSNAPGSNGRLREFMDFARIYGAVAKKAFRFAANGSDLMINFNESGAAQHSGSMIIAEGIDPKFKHSEYFDSDRFIDILRKAGNNDIKVSVRRTAMLRVDFSTEMADYSYYLRSKPLV